MCGRYALALSNEEVYDALENQLPRMFARDRPRWEREQDYRPGNYNVAPRQRMPIIHRDPQDGERAMLQTAQWGLIPHWTKHPPTAPLNTINARSESLLDSGSGGMWHALKGYKRCVIPAQGYYEWQKKPSAKIAHFTRLPDDPSSSPSNPPKSTSKPPTSTSISTPTFPLLFFAGLYDIVKYAAPVESRFKPSTSSTSPGDGKGSNEPYPTGNPVPLCTFTILTTAPPADFAWLHDRMPCILQGWDEVEAWLDLGQEPKGWVEPVGMGKGKEGVVSRGTGGLLKGRSGLECYPVPPEVGKVGTNSPTFIQPVSQRADGIKSFFQKQATTASPNKGVKGAGAMHNVGEGEGDGSGRGSKRDPAVVKEEQPSGVTMPAARTPSRGVKRERGGEAGDHTPMKDEKDLEADAGGGSGEKGSKMSRSSSPGPAGTSKAKTDEDEGRHGEIKADEPTVIKDEQGGRDEEPGLGVDSNAPLPDESKAADSNGKVKAEGDDGDNVEEGAIEIDDDARPGTDEAKEPQEDDERVKKKPKRGGQEIKVTRRPEEAKTDSSITSFFSSPAKDKDEDKDKEGAKAGSRGKRGGSKPAASTRKTRTAR